MDARSTTHASRVGCTTNNDLAAQHNELSLHNITSLQLNVESKHLAYSRYRAQQRKRYHWARDSSLLGAYLFFIPISGSLFDGTANSRGGLARLFDVSHLKRSLSKRLSP